MFGRSLWLVLKTTVREVYALQPAMPSEPLPEACLDLIKRVQYLCTASRTLSKEEIREVKALDEITLARCREQAHKLVRTKPRSPVLMVNILP